MEEEEELVHGISSCGCLEFEMMMGLILEEEDSFQTLHHHHLL